jgi:hypothetical protein
VGTAIAPRALCWQLGLPHMTSISSWRFGRIATVSAVWMAVVAVGYWPAWRALALWLANRRAQAGPMPIRFTDYEHVVDSADLIVFALVLLVPPLALLAIWREGRASASAHLT